MDFNGHEAIRRHKPPLYLKASPKQTNDCRILLITSGFHERCLEIFREYCRADLIFISFLAIQSAKDRTQRGIRTQVRLLAY